MPKENLTEKFYRSLYRIRRVEEEIAKVYPTDKIQSPVHLSIGQEAVAVGVCEALKPEDIVFGTYRGHALYLAKGGNMKKMVAELYGKVTGSAKGKGGSMHLVDVKAGVMGTSAIVATTIPQAVGYAYAVKLQKKKIAVVSFFGDGAVDEGAFHESVNFAALKKLPVIFVCENNHYAIHSHQYSRHGRYEIVDHVRAYGLKAERIESGDVFKIHERISKARARLSSGKEGPFFFECMTYRWREHVGPNEDFKFGYRSRREAQPWFKNDQVARLADMLDPARRQRIERQVETEIKRAFLFAEKSPFPEARELYTDLFKS